MNNLQLHFNREKIDIEINPHYILLTHQRQLKKDDQIINDEK